MAIASKSTIGSLIRSNGLLLGFSLCLWLSTPSTLHAQSTSELQRTAAKFERARDCEGAYKSYLALQVAARNIKSRRRRISLLAYVANKLDKYKPCFEKCTPSDEETRYLTQAKGYQQRGQTKRAYRIYLRVLRGKNPRCSSWKEAHQARRSLAARLPKRRGQKNIDPCDVSPETSAELQKIAKELTTLQTELQSLQKPMTLPPAPAPPKWARSKRQKRWWLRRWERRQRRKQRRQFESIQVKRLRATLRVYRQIDQLREKAFSLREDLQNCDKIYTTLKSQSRSLRTAQNQTRSVMDSIYTARIGRIRGQMRWFSRRYWKMKRAQKRDKQSIKDLKRALEQQRETLDSVSQDLMSLASLLVFKQNQKGENKLLGGSLDTLQKMMTDQKQLFAAMKKQYPQYMNSSGGRRALRQHIATLERFEKAVERMQGQNAGKGDEKLNRTLQQVRASILLLEKAEDGLNTTKGSAAASNGTLATAGATANANAGGTNNSKLSWGLLLLILGLLLGGGAGFYLWRERKSRSFDRF